jgi:hypothetical protein
LSLYNSSDQDFRIVITGHEKPNVAELRDPRVTFRASSFEKPSGPKEFARDKARKQRSNLEWIKDQGGGDVVMADADDLFHRDLFRVIREADHSNGHIIKRGYVFDMTNGKLAPIPGAWSKAFDAICGSSAILRLTPSEIREKTRIQKLGPHNRIEENSILMGRPLHVIDWPAAIYVLGARETVSSTAIRTPTRQAELHDIIFARSIEITPDTISAFMLQPLINETTHGGV